MDVQSIPRSPVVYTIDEFARDHRISRSQVYAEISEGRLVARKIGTRTGILEIDAAAWRDALPTMTAKQTG